jgi:hypothetical protein
MHLWPYGSSQEQMILHLGRKAILMMSEKPKIFENHICNQTEFVLGAKEASLVLS